MADGRGRKSLLAPVVGALLLVPLLALGIDGVHAAEPAVTIPAAALIRPRPSGGGCRRWFSPVVASGGCRRFSSTPRV